MVIGVGWGRHPIIHYTSVKQKVSEVSETMLIGTSEQNEVTDTGECERGMQDICEELVIFVSLLVHRISCLTNDCHL